MFLFLLLHSQPVAVGSTNLPLKIFSALVVQLTAFLIKKAPQGVTVRMGTTKAYHAEPPARLAAKAATDTNPPMILKIDNPSTP